MPPNTQQQGAETRSIQRSVQVLLTVSGIVFLLAGLVLAASGASVSSAIGSVTDRFDDSSQPADDIDSSNGDAADDGSGNETDDTSGDSGDTGDGGDSDGGDGDTGDGDSNGGDSDGDNGNSDDDSDGGDSDDGNTGGDDSDGSDNGDSSDSDDETHTLSVSVVDQDGDAVDGADVSLDDFFSDEKTTGGDGEVEWELEDGTYGVTANADGYQSAEDNVEIDGDDESVELTLEEEDDRSNDDDSSDDSNTVTFIVEDQDGDPLEDATVALEQQSLFGGKEEKTVDQNGEVDFERENGTYSYIVAVDGNESDEQTVEVDGDMEQPVTIETTDG